MAIWQGDVFFRRIIELTLKDMRDNPWLIDDILSDFVNDPMLSGVYGQKEIENAKKWFKENDINIYLPHRLDLTQMPCITISIGSNTEDRRLARLGDQTPFVEEYDASDIGKTIQYVQQPFEYTNYTQSTGYIETPPEVDLTVIGPGMVVVDPSTGGGFVIAKKDAGGIYIAENSVLPNTTIGVLPQYRTWRARREIATFQERITLGCHVHGDPHALLWLYSILMYGLLRYREGALESRNFQISNLETTDMIRNDGFQNIGENVYSRFITISGQVENTWVKAPKRFVEAVTIREENGDAFKAGLRIVDCNGTEVPEIIDEECEPWVAGEEPEE